MLVLVGIWFSLDAGIKCKLIYGKNICNFYEMINMMNSENPDFEKAMRLCREIGDVPKKDKCFEYIAENVSAYDKEKAKKACEEIKEIKDQVGNIVHKKEDCYSLVEKSIEERLAESAVVAFMKARLQRNEELALSRLTDGAKGQYLLRSDLPLTGLSNPHFADFEILEREKLDSEKFKFKVRIYEEYTGQGRVGYFDEALTLIKNGDRYLVDAFERSEYTNL